MVNEFLRAAWILKFFSDCCTEERGKKNGEIGNARAGGKRPSNTVRLRSLDEHGLKFLGVMVYYFQFKVFSYLVLN